MKAVETLTHERLLEVIEYDPITGIFRWRSRYPARFKFAGKVAGQMHVQGYRIIKIDNVMHRAGRLAYFYMTGGWPTVFLDHRNLNRADDSWENLRSATTSQNAANSPMPKTNKSGKKGVNKSPKGCRLPWQAQICHDNKKIHLGTFATVEDAHAAYVAAATKLHGVFARAS